MIHTLKVTVYFVRSNIKIASIVTVYLFKAFHMISFDIITNMKQYTNYQALHNVSNVRRSMN